MSDSLSQLVKKLSYRFNDLQLLGQALTHRSYGGENNERLEFLGDALLNTAISSELFKRHPELDEGALTRMRASLVNQNTLAAVANDIELGDYLCLGPGELKSGGQRRSSILADALEAILGAVYIDTGYASVHFVVLHLFNSRLSSLVSSELPKDSKTQLQEALQARMLPLPIYTVESVSGQAHQQKFEVSCSVASLGINARGIADSRRAAEQEAARHVLDSLPDA